MVKHRRWTRVGLLAAVGVLVASSTPAAAITPNHVLGGRWSASGVGYVCNVYIGTPSAWCGNVWGPGANGWAPSVFSLYPAAAGRERVRAIVDNYGQSFQGAAWHEPNSYSGTYSYAYAVIDHYNTSNAAGLHARQTGVVASTQDKACTAAHEFGHVIGLEHHDNSTGTIMRRYHEDRCGHSSLGTMSPAGHDFADVSYLY